MDVLQGKRKKQELRKSNPRKGFFRNHRAGTTYPIIQAQTKKVALFTEPLIVVFFI